MKSWWAPIVQINSIHSKGNACSALMPTGWEGLKDVTLLSFHWHPLLFLHKVSKALCLSPCPECWKLSDVPVSAEGSRQGSTVTLIAGMGLLHAGPQGQSWSEPGGVQWCSWECKNEHSEKWMAQHPQKYRVFQALQLCMEYGAIAVNGNRAKAMTVTHIMCYCFYPSICVDEAQDFMYWCLGILHISNHYYQHLSSGCTASRI